MAAPACIYAMPYLDQPVTDSVLSPCIGVCELRADGLCAGCLRSGDEIAGWTRFDDATRRHLMEAVLPLREAANG
jgi:uncharacterized protein